MEDILIKSAKYVHGTSSIGTLPKPVLPEYAFVGRSNVGKSSLINMLTGRKSLARTSNTPGKTQIINHFLINDRWYLVDLPGYGYAKRSKSNRKEWGELIRSYLVKRENLLCVFSLIDSRLEPQDNDMEFLEFLGTNQIPFVIVFTKVDKLSSHRLKNSLVLYKKELLKFWETVPRIFQTSAKNRAGRQEILQFIDETNRYLDVGGTDRINIH